MLIKCSVEDNLKLLLSQEDTDKDFKITIEDKGPKKFFLRSLDGKRYEVAGTYYLSNLLQELVLAKDQNKKNVELDTNKIFELPVERISRMIKNYYWNGLTRSIDTEGLQKIMSDSKAETDFSIIYVPHSDSEAYQYFKRISKTKSFKDLKVFKLPAKITPEFVLNITNQPGVLSLALKKNRRGKIEGVPFVVPGGRFNEMYGWDSYFISLGLLNDGKINLSKCMTDNFIYEIKHYGKILNANRSYYLTRSQPPFLTSMILEVYKRLPRNKTNKRWLKQAVQTAIKEYKTIWMNYPHLTFTGLSRYFGDGIGMPPETEPTHFDSILKPFADKANMSLHIYRQKYLNREIVNKKLDDYFIHDRSMRESGHDTSYRLEGRSANLVTVDLNSLLFKYEVDIARILLEEFEGSLLYRNGAVEKSEDWLKLAKKRKLLINKYLWNDRRGMFFDYDFVKKRQTNFVSATLFYPLWAGLASKKQAAKLIKIALPLLEESGGIVASTKDSRGRISKNRPQRQWDYPFGWAPHQMIVWQGLKNYGYNKISERLAYRWLFTIIRNAVDYNGTIPEKYDVVSRSHKVFAEYGNVGTEFRYITKEGFGWMNASFQIGKTYLSDEHLEALNRLVPPEWLF